jgi:hypothetical protein|tara:strand:+ start:407 stop:817 length:411 start_codon:yes stop_codon:yes gene_type:complete
MKFKITKLTVDSVSVDYDDGSYAVVPITKNMDLNQIKDSIAGYNNPPSPFDKVGDIPLKVGDEIEYVRSEEDDNLTYAQARAANYPSVGSQLDALYWERQGDDTQRKLYDVKIKEVKDKIPKSGTYKKSEVDTLLD